MLPLCVVKDYIVWVWQIEILGVANALHTI